MCRILTNAAAALAFASAGAAGDAQTTGGLPYATLTKPLSDFMRLPPPSRDKLIFIERVLTRTGTPLTPPPRLTILAATVPWWFRSQPTEPLPCRSPLPYALKIRRSASTSRAA